MYYIDQAELKSLYDLGFKKQEKRKERIRIIFFEHRIKFCSFSVNTCFLISLTLCTLCIKV